MVEINEDKRITSESLLNTLDKLKDLIDFNLNEREIAMSIIKIDKI